MKLSIITVCFNNREGLERTMQSISSQSNQNFEVIVIDGGSKDGTLEVIERYQNRIDYWVSEPDRGIYHAMNKGVSIAKGKYCIFMNSGDSFFNDQVVEYFLSEEREEDVLCGDILYRKGDKPIKYIEAPREPNTFFFLTASLPHQSSFVKTARLRELPYIEEYRIVADFVFFFELLVVGVGTYRKLNFYVADGDMEGISHTRMEQLWQEKRRYLSTVVPKKVLDDLDKYVWITKDIWGYTEGSSWLKMVKGGYAILKFWIRLISKVRRRIHLYLVLQKLK